jgi:hypothetical protein
MTDQWNEQLYCPQCRQTGMASLFQSKEARMPTVDGIPDGFKAVPSKYGPYFHCGVCDVPVVCFYHRPLKALPYGDSRRNHPKSERSIYLLHQADKCLWHANRISDVEAQARLRELAAEYIESAAEIDNDSEPPDVLRFDRTTESLEQENAWLKERLAQIRGAMP